MRKSNKINAVLVVLFVLLLSLTVWAVPSFAEKLADAIAKTPQGAEKGMISPGAKPGFLGIPGAPMCSDRGGTRLNRNV